MKLKNKYIKGIKHTSLSFFTIMLSVFFLVIPGFTEDNTRKTFSPEVDTELLSAEIIRFDKPIRIGVGKRVIEYQEALVLKAQVDREEFDSLPPNIEPFLYIGTEESRIFYIDRDDERREIILTFHIIKWENLKDGAPVVLTIDHDAPIRDPEKFIRMETPRFRKSMIVDKR